MITKEEALAFFERWAQARVTGSLTFNFSEGTCANLDERIHHSGARAGRIEKR